MEKSPSLVTGPHLSHSQMPT